MLGSGPDLRPLDGPRSLGEDAADAIREQILNGGFQRGEHLVEARIAQRLGISRGPVREAFKLLRAEGLVAEKARDGFKLSLATSLRRNPVDALNPAWKTGNYLNNVLCLREARARGADEVVMLNHAGEVTESAVSNIAFVRDGTLITPPLSAGILGGITRDLVVGRIAAAANVPVREAAVRAADFSAMQECMLLSTTKDIAPVASIDDVRFQLGAGTVSARLKAAFADYAKAYVQAHQDWRA